MNVTNIMWQETYFEKIVKFKYTAEYKQLTNTDLASSRTLLIVDSGSLFIKNQVKLGGC